MAILFKRIISLSFVTTFCTHSSHGCKIMLATSGKEEFPFQQLSTAFNSLRFNIFSFLLPAPRFWDCDLDDPDVVLALLFSWRRARATRSRSNSLVGNAAQVLSLNVRNRLPRDVVTRDKISKVGSVCIWSLARPCQWARSNRSSRTHVFCGSGKRPSKTGIAHYDS